MAVVAVETPTVKVKAEVPDIKMDPHLKPAAYTGNLGKEPGYVLTSTPVLGGTLRTLGHVTTGTSSPVQRSPTLKTEKLTNLTKAVC